jgi:hypothetical protein
VPAALSVGRDLAVAHEDQRGHVNSRGVDGGIVVSGSGRTALFYGFPGSGR